MGLEKAIVEEGIILVRKPKGITSFDVVSRIRHTLNIKKVGHAGTLDPNATGLLIIGIGSGTKKLGKYLKLPKSYHAEILLGKSMNTGDITGEIVEEKSASHLTVNQILDTLASLRGKSLLPVPRYSAIKKDGIPLYKRARAGEVFEPPKKEMEILEITAGTIVKVRSGFLVSVDLRVTSGTYIRSIAEELGRKLCVPATLSDLVRTSIGNYSLDGAVELSEVSNLRPYFLK